MGCGYRIIRALVSIDSTSCMWMGDKIQDRLTSCLLPIAQSKESTKDKPTTPNPDDKPNSKNPSGNGDGNPIRTPVSQSSSTNENPCKEQPASGTSKLSSADDSPSKGTGGSTTSACLVAQQSVRGNPMNAASQATALSTVGSSPSTPTVGSSTSSPVNTEPQDSFPGSFSLTTSQTSGPANPAPLVTTPDEYRYGFKWLADGPDSPPLANTYFSNGMRGSTYSPPLFSQQPARSSGTGTGFWACEYLSFGSSRSSTPGATQGLF